MKSCRTPKSRINYAKPNDNKVVISSEYYKNDRPSCLCSFCNCTLSKLKDAGQNNIMYFCTRCSIEFDPESENLRKESKITVPDRNTEPAVSTTPGIPDISIRKEPEIKGGLLELKRKGLKITDYHEDIPKPRRNESLLRRRFSSLYDIVDVDTNTDLEVVFHQPW
jgi:hypothetical protein